MDNRTKMIIKSIPFVSSFAKGANRTVGRFVRNAVAYPEMRERNGALLKRLSYLSEVGGSPRIWYFGVPRHSNLGDLAQKFCISRWLESHYDGWEIVKIASAEFNGGVQRTIEQLRCLVEPDDIFVMQSGHTMDGLHIDEPAHRSIPNAFPENRVVFFPTSIAEMSRRGLRKDSRAIDPHPRTLFLARDPVSFEKAKRLYPHVNIRLFPDVVTSLIGSYSFSFERAGVLLCMRNDGEKLYSYDAIDALAGRLEEIFPVERVDTTVDWRSVDLDSEVAWRRIEGVIESYARYRVIVTDRYHGTIFARIAGTPVVVLKTTDHKVTSGAQWFIDAGDEAIAISANLEEAEVLARELADRFPDGKEAPAFATSYYDALQDIIEAI